MGWSWRLNTTIMRQFKDVSKEEDPSIIGGKPTRPKPGTTSKEWRRGLE